MQDDILEKVVEITARWVQSESVCTGQHPEDGEQRLYVHVRKLRDLSVEHRQLAYGLMELMADNGNRGEEWEVAVQTMDQAIRSG